MKIGHILSNIFSFGVGGDDTAESFLQLFLAKRMEQLQAVKNILMLGE